ncbi:MAG: ANTAR domain-containing protein [Pirellulaceae bacterium]|nr:ANTAR domain-containing protein [Planctomycetales bacterium]
MQKQPPFSLTIECRSEGVSDDFVDALPDYGIILQRDPYGSQGSPHGVLVTADPDRHAWLLRELSAIRSDELVAIVYLPDAEVCHGRFTAHQADAVVTNLHDPLQFAAVAWCGYQHVQSRRQSNDTIRDLQRRLEEKKIIDLAARVVAKQKQIAESDAVAVMRTKARGKRIKLIDVARSVLDSASLLCPSSERGE